LPERIEAGPGVEPEDGAEDDLQGEVLHLEMQLERLVAGQRRHFFGGHFRHQVGEAFHALAVEGGQHQLALLHVATLVEQDHRVGSDQGFEDPSAPARMQDVGRRREDFLHLGRIGEDHKRRGGGQFEREALAVARPALLLEGERAGPEADHLNRRGIGRTGG
jgi:hypothetical protein